MTLPASGNITTDMIMAELRITNPGRSYPLNLNDSDVRSLCGIASGQISLPGNFYGKGSGGPVFTATGNNSVQFSSSFGGAGTCTTTPSVTVSNSSGGTTYNWSVTSQSGGCTFGPNGGSGYSVSHTFGNNTNGSANAVLQCIVGDNTGHSYTVTGVTANLSWQGNQ